MKMQDKNLISTTAILDTKTMNQLNNAYSLKTNIASKTKKTLELLELIKSDKMMKPTRDFS